MNGENSKSSIRPYLAGGFLVLVAFIYGVLKIADFFDTSTKQEIPIVSDSASTSTETNSNKLAEQREATVLFVGDIMLDRNVANVIRKVGFDKFFSGVKELVSSADVAVANLEGPFTEYPSRTTDLTNKELTFTFDPVLAPQIAELGFDVLGLANNHTLNFGRDGLEQTRGYIIGAGMKYYGDPTNGVGSTSKETSTIVEKNGIKIGLVGFHEFSYVGLDQTLAQINTLRPQVDVLFVTPHWGVEYQASSTKYMQKLAHQFIDHGADAVIGTHSHVVGANEVYQNKPIFYSLGNFAFDQYFSKEVMRGLALSVSISKQSDGTPASAQYTPIFIDIRRDGITIE